ncbi:RDD family protein [Halorubrum sp. DTA46]|uniref:RDD family protein n=1 Tax=Halorubrum sp. DTA46 TaxID=3402162 RepID=UPI003AAF266E
MDVGGKIEPTEETTDVVVARGIAHLIDYFASFIVIFPVLYTYVLAVNPARDSVWITAPIVLSYLAYNTLFEAYWNGQTIGKRVTGIRVVDRDGADPSLKEALIRNVPAGFPIAGTLGIFAALWAMVTTDLRQRNFDIFADTYVVTEGRQGAADRRPDDSDSETYEFRNFGSKN